MLEDYDAATQFFCKIIGSDDVLPVKTMLNRIRKAPKPARDYLERKCRDAAELEEFFKDNDHLFFLQNKRVALFNEQHETASELAVQFFKTKLESYGKPVHFYKLKTDNLEETSDLVGDFITRFYPGKEFKEFIRKHPDVFALHQDHSVSLVQIASVQYFKKVLKALKGKEVIVSQLKGHVGQAPLHVQEFINGYYPGNDLVNFLMQHNTIFLVDQNYVVTLAPVQ